MLAKKNRVSSHNVNEIFKKGKFLNTENLTFKFFFPSGLIKSQISCIVPKSVVSGAVKRNKQRRMLYRILKSHFNDFPAGLMGALMYKKYTTDKVTLEKEVVSILNKLK